MKQRTFFERYSDRSFVLTVLAFGYAIYSQSKGVPVQDILPIVGLISPFILGEKYKDACAVAAQKPGKVVAGTVQGDVTSQGGASDATN